MVHIVMTKGHLGHNFIEDVYTNEADAIARKDAMLKYPAVKEAWVLSTELK